MVLIGIAQEKAPVWRSWKAKGQEHAAHPHMEWGRQMAFINHFYFYCATRRLVVFPVQLGGTRREVLGSNGLPRSER